MSKNGHSPLSVASSPETRRLLGGRADEGIEVSQLKQASSAPVISLSLPRVPPSKNSQKERVPRDRSVSTPWLHVK